MTAMTRHDPQRRTLMRAPFDATYTVLNHTADIGFILQGDSPEAVFARAVEAVFATMGAPTHPSAGGPFSLTVRGESLAQALFNLVSELIFHFEVSGHYWRDVTEVVVTRAALETARGHDGDGDGDGDGGGEWAVALTGRGCHVDRAQPQGLIEVKAPTYHGLAWKAQRPGLVAARIILDL
jgi:SHS2 domain-containing protein